MTKEKEIDQVFKAEDFMDGDKPFRHDYRAADKANARLAEIMKDAPRLYSHQIGGQGDAEWVTSLQKRYHNATCQVAPWTIKKIGGDNK